jgi:hypothetical protein
MENVERGRTVQLWRVADGRSDATVPLRSERGSDALLTVFTGIRALTNLNIMIEQYLKKNDSCALFTSE